MENNIHSCIIGIRLQQPWQQVGTALRMETRSKKISKRAAVFMSRLDAMVFFCAAGIKSFQEEDLDRIISYITYYIYMCVCLYIYICIYIIYVYISCVYISCVYILCWHDIIWLFCQVPFSRILPGFVGSPGWQISSMPSYTWPRCGRSKRTSAREVLEISHVKIRMCIHIYIFVYVDVCM